MEKEKDYLEENEEKESIVEEIIAEEDLLEDQAVDEFSVLIKLQEENKKLKEDYLRAYADAENTKKRCQQEIEKNNKYAIASFAKNLLGVADNLMRAIQAVPADKQKDCENLLKGVEMTSAELDNVFAKFGITKLESLGSAFDPNFHQVVQEVEDKDKPAGTIVSELQTGYMINDRILREAVVVVTKK